MDNNKLFQRWTAKVDFTLKPSGCWLWKGSKDANGYGKIRLGDKCVYAATVAWQLYKGEEPKSHLYRTCDNPACVNPDHLQEKIYIPPTTEEERQDRFEDAMRRVGHYCQRHHHS